jgi:hypothetical protein
MLESWQVSHFYINADLQVPRLWNLSRKHVRVRTLDGRFVKLNKHRSRLNARALRDLCITLAPCNVYFSVLDWLRPEAVGKKSPATSSAGPSSWRRCPWTERTSSSRWTPCA